MDGFNLDITRGSLWIWESLPHWIWDQHSSSEHNSVQQWTQLWSLFWDPMQLPEMVSQWPAFYPDHRDKLLPPKPCASQQCWWLVQLPLAALRHVTACFPTHRYLPSRHRSCFVSKVCLWQRLEMYRSLVVNPIPVSHVHYVHQQRFHIWFNSCVVSSISLVTW